MKLLMINDYQFPVIACFSLFFAMISYWISLALPKNTFSFTIGKRCVLFSNLLFALTLGAVIFHANSFSDISLLRRPDGSASTTIVTSTMTKKEIHALL